MIEIILAMDVYLVILFLACAFAEPSVIHVREGHHGYIGDLLVVVGFMTSHIIGLEALIFASIGIIFRIDDSWQHLVQLINPIYQSPLHRLYAEYLWPLPIVQKLTAFWNSLWEKK